jgi:8-oxo-dGTP diphosphatase
MTDLSAYSGKVRVRVGGICVENDRILLLRLQNFGAAGHFWLPPGGGVQFGETLEDALCREFAEETGLQIAIERFICANQVIKPPLHAVEFFFSVKIISGSLQIGTDPELPSDKQKIDRVEWLTWDQIRQLPPETCHNLFHNCQTLADFLQLQGIYHLL